MLFGLLAEPLLPARAVLCLLLGEDGLVIGLSGGQHVEEDAGQFVGRRGDGLWACSFDRYLA